MGTAMTMAMNEMSAVPANSGTAPKDPDEPTWSARMAICGLHDVPNRKSIGETMEKKRKASKATEATMPMVVNTAIVEQPISIHSMTRSTPIAGAQLGRDARADHDHGADGHHHDQHGERHAADAAQLACIRRRRRAPLR